MAEDKKEIKLVKVMDVFGSAIGGTAKWFPLYCLGGTSADAVTMKESIERGVEAQRQMDSMKSYYEKVIKKG